MFWSKKKVKSAGNSASAITFELFDPKAKHVFLAGDFNSWDTKVTPLKKDSTGRWTVTVLLERGRHEYRFYVDGEWRNDQRPVYLVDNSFGTQNCVIEV